MEQNLTKPATEKLLSLSYHITVVDAQRYERVIVISSFCLSFCPSVRTPFHSYNSIIITPIKLKFG